MDGQLHTAAEAAGILKVRESWLKTKAAARLIPCTFIGKHLRFSDDDIAEIMRAGARQPITSRERDQAAGPPDRRRRTTAATALHQRQRRTGRRRPKGPAANATSN